MIYIPRILGYLRPFWKLATLSVVLTVLDALVDLLSPWPLKILVDNVLGNTPLPPLLDRPVGSLFEDRFLLLALVVASGLGITLLNSGLTVINNFVQAKVDQGMVLNFRSDLFQHTQRLSLAFHDQRRTGDFMNRINYQASSIGDLTMMVPTLAQSLLTLVGMFVVTLMIDVQLALLALTVVPFLYYSIGYYARRIQPRLMQVKGLEGQSLTIIHEAMSMLRVILAFCREPYEHRKFRTQGETAVDARVRITVRQTAFSLAVNVITASGTALVLGFGAYKVLQNELTVGHLLVVMSYIAAVYTPLQTISSAVAPIQDLLVNLRMSFELLDTDPEIKDAPNAIHLEKAQGRISFEGVDFSYQSRTDTLKNISFEAQAGQVIAVVGPTGAGKTTLVSLIPRFYDPQQGRILLDGQDIRTLTVRSLREQISLVLQEPLLFSGTIAENIRYGRLEATQEEIIQAAQDANAHDFIMRLPQQYETKLGERGAQLSGGERQRICVARAFLKDAPILILDEPTSAIDSKTEAVILEALDRLMVGRTTFMIAHRLSTVHHADKILVLQHGELTEQGTHEALLEKKGLYRQLHDVQTGQVRRRRHAPAPVAVAPVGEVG